MPIFFKLQDVRYTQSLGWVIDVYLTETAILPVSLPFDYRCLYQLGGVFNARRQKIKELFEQKLSERYIGAIS